MTGGAEKKKRHSHGVLFVALLNLIVISSCVYIVVRTILLTGKIGLDVNGILAVALILGEAFIMFQSLAFSINLVGARKAQFPEVSELENPGNAPDVAILVPARHEPFEVLDRTFLCLYNLDYPNKNLYFLDDSSDEEYRQEAEQLALTYGASVFRRNDRHGAKAGIINDCIKTLEEKYIVIFDSDQNPTPGFITDLVSIMEADSKLAFVQTPQFYTNTDASAVTRGANMQHCMFYEYICEGKSARGAMILCGTNAILRREALQQVGGLDENSVTEDFSTTIDWHVKGWKSLYYPNAGVFGKGPETLEAYFGQQFRWSRGNLGVLSKVFKNMILHPFSMSLSQWWEHLATGSYYLIGWAYFLLMICPITYLFFDTPTFFMKPEIYFLTFIPYFLLSFAIFYAGMADRNYRPKGLITGILLGFISFPVYMKAAFAALFNLRTTFKVTRKNVSESVAPYRVIWMQIVLWVVHFGSLVWGTSRLIADREPSVLMSLVWVAYHFLMLSSVFFFRVAGIRGNRNAAAGNEG